MTFNYEEVGICECCSKCSYSEASDYKGVPFVYCGQFKAIKTKNMDLIACIWGLYL